jgi:SAM-dependent methyltransferase
MECDVDISLDESVDLPFRYNDKHRFLSSRNRQIHVEFCGRRIYSATVPQNVFNPYKGVAAHKLIELVLNGEIPVEDRRVVDLGCGSGVIGLAAIHKRAASVLFTDINPAVLPLRQHSMLRPMDEVKVQDLLKNEAAASFDVILVSTPTNAIPADRPIESGSVESAIFRTERFLDDLIAEAGRCLASGGTLAMWVKMSHRGLLPYHHFLTALNRSFDIATMEIFWHALEADVAVGLQETSEERSHLIFSIRKYCSARGKD